VARAVSCCLASVCPVRSHASLPSRFSRSLMRALRHDIDGTAWHARLAKEPHPWRASPADAWPRRGAARRARRPAAQRPSERKPSTRFNLTAACKSLASPLWGGSHISRRSARCVLDRPCVEASANPLLSPYSTASALTSCHHTPLRPSLRISGPCLGWLLSVGTPLLRSAYVSVSVLTAPSSSYASLTRATRVSSAARSQTRGSNFFLFGLSGSPPTDTTPTCSIKLSQFLKK